MGYSRENKRHSRNAGSFLVVVEPCPDEPTPSIAYFRMLLLRVLNSTTDFASVIVFPWDAVGSPVGAEWVAFVNQGWKKKN